MLNRVFLILVFLIIARPSLAQVLLIQVTDFHSKNLQAARMVQAIDEISQEYLTKIPKGEIVTYFIGDITSIDPYTAKNGSWSTLEMMRILRERGYTVLFTPGNHDAFDWTVKIDGVELFIQQMRQLKSWGVKILVDNLKGKTDVMRSLRSKPYRLKTIKPRSYLVGMTLPNLMNKSNLIESSSEALFKGVEPLETATKRVLPQLVANGAENIYFGIHQSHHKVAKLGKAINRIRQVSNLEFRVPLMMAAHDHMPAAYRSRGTLISDAGSHGSFNVIQINRRGRVERPITHFAHSAEAYNDIKWKHMLEANAMLNPVARADIANSEIEGLKQYDDEIRQHRQEVDVKLSRVLGTTKGLHQHKFHLKQGPAELGNILSDSLEMWVKKLPLVYGSQKTVIAMTNSSSYRTQSGIPEGSITELFVREIYPFHTEATLWRMTGGDIERLYFSLREDYGRNNPEQHSPHLNTSTREKDGRLEIKVNNNWRPIQLDAHYWLALDGWLSEHRYGQSYRIKTWTDRILDKKPLAAKSYQDLLVKHFAGALAQYEEGQTGRRHPMPFFNKKRNRACKLVFN